MTVQPTTITKPEYRIETRFGFYSVYEKIGGYTFPAKYDATFQGATLYDVKKRALSEIKRLRAAGQTVNLHEISGR